MSDTDSQFAGKGIKWFLEELHIEHRFQYVRRTQMNGMVEPVNKVVLKGLKKRVDTLEINWSDELGKVLRAI